jgi:DNA (cytosine-5)-methyltransferase 1
LNAADYGDPTTRERLFVIARRGGKKIIWPRQTHAPADKLKAMASGLFKNKPLKKWVAAREIIDWKIQGKSIFNRKKPLAPKTLQRIYAGLNKFGGPNAEPFLIVLRQHMGAQSVNDPIPTLSAGGTHMALCEPFMLNIDHRGGNGNQCRSADKPLSTVTTKARTAVVEPFLIGRVGPAGSGKPQSVNVPLNTVMTENHRAVVEPFMLGQQSKCAPRSVRHPVPTVATHGAISMIEADAFLVDVNHGVKPGSDATKEAERRSQSIHQPIGTITAGSRGKGVVEPCLVQYNGTATAQSISDPLNTVTSKDRYALVTTDSGTYALDIRLRMLRPHELAAAMSLNNYKLMGKMEDQVKQIGNAVPVQLAKALCSEVIR